MWENFIYFVIFVSLTSYGWLHFKKVKKKEPLLFFTIMLLNGVLIVLNIIEIDIPTPLDLITFVFQPFGDMLYNLFS